MKAIRVMCAMVAMFAMACGQSNGRSSASSGSLAMSTDDAYLYAVDTDNAVLAVIDTKLIGSNQEPVIATVKVGKSPVRVVVGSDDMIYVSNQGDRSVSVIRRDDWQEASRIPVGVEPNGMALSTDGKMLYVVSAASLSRTDVGLLTAIETKSLTAKWEIEVGAEPRAIALVGEDRALVSLYKVGEVQEIDLNTRAVKQEGLGIYNAANASQGAISYSGISTFHARALTDVVVTPDGTRAFVPTVWAREDAITKKPTSSGGYYSAEGPCNLGSVASAGLITVDTRSTATPEVDDLTGCYGTGVKADSDFPTTVLNPTASTGVYYGGPAPSSAGNAVAAFQGPSVAAIDRTGNWVYVVGKETSNLIVVPAFKRFDQEQLDDSAYSFRSTGTSIRDGITVGAANDSCGADGIALSGDGHTAYVYCQFDHRVVSVRQNKETNTLAKDDSRSVTVIKSMSNGDLTPEQAIGRKYFFNANNTLVSSSLTNVACATCHLGGGDDAHVWNFPDGPRQTPALAGRHLLETAPFHWTGKFTGSTGLEAFQTFMTHTVTERMGGSGLTADINQKIASYLDVLPAPENPYRKAELTEEQMRGAKVFNGKAGCNACHAGALFTNNEIKDVGTTVPQVAQQDPYAIPSRNPDSDFVVDRSFNVPSLLGIARSAPYLHDGSAKTLEDRLFNNPNDKHGTTSALTDGERGDLIAYLKSI